MLTQFETTEPRAALLVACSRPRALALHLATPVTTTIPVPVTTVPAASAPSEWSLFAPISAPASARVPGFGAVAGSGYPVFAPRSMAGVRTHAAVRRDGNGTVGLNGENGSNGTKQQDQKNLTARREPVTWRPPH
jgi:hypothetical protein